MHLTLSVPDGDALLAWAADAQKRQAAHVVFRDARGGAPLETLALGAAYCVSYREEFVSGSGTDGACLCHLVLSAPDGFTIQAGGPATAFVAPAAREHELLATAIGGQLGEGAASPCPNRGCCAHCWRAAGGLGPCSRRRCSGTWLCRGMRRGRAVARRASPSDNSAGGILLAGAAAGKSSSVTPAPALRCRAAFYQRDFGRREAVEGIYQRVQLLIQPGQALAGGGLLLLVLLVVGQPLAFLGQGEGAAEAC